ncbi:hypothetical protein MIR68_003406 [Amoeboaphelidium protococcarum]|nr:hypothetical protein MIR68_003406 [Amoeboaphelidium protococcarum]
MPKSSKNKVPDPSTYNSVVDGLKTLYKMKIKPLEENYRFNDFHSAALTDIDIEAKPFVLLMGQYSTGKTSFIQYLLDRAYPGSHVGVEPTTDKFVAIMNGADDKVIPGQAAAVSSDLPFRGLTRFGSSFLNKFQVSQLPVPFLENVTLIDSPGILSGEKHSLGRAYDFNAVIEWFAERCDLILLLFDGSKLDISPELKSAIDVLKPHSEKIRVVLNKCDLIKPQELMRVYGALMWSLGKVVNTPEVIRVYIGSFWDNIDKNHDNYALYMSEMEDLLHDLRDLPRNAGIRKINELVKRSRMAKVHAQIIGHLKAQLPSVFGKNKKLEELIQNLDQEFLKVQKQYHLPVGDFPDLEKFRNNLKTYNLYELKKLDPKLITSMDDVLGVDLPKLMALFPQGNRSLPDHERNPFGDDDNENKVVIERPFDWSSVERSRYVAKFQKLNPIDGKIAGNIARPILMESQLPTADLGKIWALSDLTKDGYLDSDEFVLSQHLIRLRLAGIDLPDILPQTLLPPKSKV